MNNLHLFIFIFILSTNVLYSLRIDNGKVLVDYVFTQEQGYDNIDQEYLNINLSLAIFVSTVNSLAESICSNEYYHNNYLLNCEYNQSNYLGRSSNHCERRQQNCLSDKIRMVRAFKVQAVYDLFRHYNLSSVDDTYKTLGSLNYAEIFTLTYVYDYIPELKERKVIYMINLPFLTTLFFILCSGYVLEINIIVFQSSSSLLQKFIAHEINNIADTIYGVKINYIEVYDFSNALELISDQSAQTKIDVFHLQFSIDKFKNTLEKFMSIVQSFIQNNNNDHSHSLNSTIFILMKINEVDTFLVDDNRQLYSKSSININLNLKSSFQFIWKIKNIWSSLSKFYIVRRDPMNGFLAFGFNSDPCCENILTNIMVGNIDTTYDHNSMLIQEEALLSYYIKDFRNKLNILFCITYYCEIFAANAEGLHYALKKLNYTSIILNDISLEIYDKLKEKYDNTIMIQIQIGQEMTNLFPFYIIFQMEQVKWFYNFQNNLTSPSYYNQLANSLCVLDFSYDNRDYLSNVMKYQNFFTVPLYTYNPNNNNNKEFVENSLNYPTYDVLFYGTCSNRRKIIIEALSEQLKYNEIKIKFNCRKSFSLNGLFGQEREYSIYNAKIIINIHAEEKSSLEVHRINYLLSMGKCIISERSLFDKELDNDYKDSIYFLNDLDSLHEVIILILSNPSIQTFYEKKAFELFNKINNDTDSLKIAMEKAIDNIYRHNLL